MAVATNWNQTSSSAVPPQPLVWLDAVAPINIPAPKLVHVMFELVNIVVAFAHSSFAIAVQNVFGPAQKLESVVLQTALT
ncbi:hypothetical protein FLBR109950_15875 [Flavobacterium branchiophilum]